MGKLNVRYLPVELQNRGSWNKNSKLLVHGIYQTDSEADMEMSRAKDSQDAFSKVKEFALVDAHTWCQQYGRGYDNVPCAEEIKLVPCLTPQTETQWNTEPD